MSAHPTSFAIITLTLVACVDTVRGDRDGSAVGDGDASSTSGGVSATPAIDPVTLTENMRLLLALEPRVRICRVTVGDELLDDVIGDDLDARLRVLPHLSSAQRAVAECIAKAPSCEAAEACAEAGLIEPCFSGDDEMCVGNVAKRCRHNPDGTRQWSSTRCEGLNATCSRGICVASVACDGPPICRGDALEVCMGGETALAIGVDCRAATGEGCTVEGEQGGCGATCQVDRCDGTVAIGCSAEQFFRSKRFDCASIGAGFGCVLDSAGLATCRAKAPTCDLDTRSFCDGDIAMLCHHSARIAVDCAAVEGGHCSEDSGEVRCTSSGPSPEQGFTASSCDACSHAD